jgi:aryl-alcohol dehydrogenase-like predicted oxidoreductase
LHQIQWRRVTPGESEWQDDGISEAQLNDRRGTGTTGRQSRGLLSGHWSNDRSLAMNDFRAYSPRFASGNLEHNLSLVDHARAIAERAGCSVAQLCIAWVAAQGDDIVPLVGARNRTRLTESLGAAGLSLSSDLLAELNTVFAPGVAAGDRYAAPLMAGLDSER